MPDITLSDPVVSRAVSNIKPRSERQPDVDVLQRTYVETGVFPQLNNTNNQILYGRRGTGKSHILRILEVEAMSRESARPLYIDVRVLGSAQLMTDDTRPLVVRCVSVFKDLLSLIQAELLDLVTDPAHDGAGLEEVSRLADVILEKSVEVSSRDVSDTHTLTDNANASVRASIGTNVGLSAGLGVDAGSTVGHAVTYNEALRDTVVFAAVGTVLDDALTALGIDQLFILIDEWTSIPPDVQPYIAEFIKRTFFPSRKIIVKIASLEYRSNFALSVPRGNPIGFELGSDIFANLDLDDYYVYDRNREKVTEIFLELLYKHVESELPPSFMSQFRLAGPAKFRTRLFTDPATFTELVRSGEGVVRDFLGIFSSAFFRAQRSGRTKIDMKSVEEAARDWFETDKSTTLSSGQRTALNRIITDVIGTRQSTMFMLAREHSDHPMIQSLFDSRLIHLISRGYSDKENPGLRYNIYSLDYGTYVDLKRTKAEPEEFTRDEEPDNRHDRVVPFADKRSIRRVILDPATLD